MGTDKHNSDAPGAADPQSTVSQSGTPGPDSTCPPPSATDPFKTTPPGVSDENASVGSMEPGVARDAAAARYFVAEQRFRVLRPMAAGGLGEVLLAYDEVFGREVALKQIRAHVGLDPRMQERFLVEALITGNLEHPGIVGVYAIGRDSHGQPFYVMRLIRGESLRDAIQRYHHGVGAGRDSGERTLALRKLLNRLVDVCNAIAYAHSRGVLHRDIKPANIMVGKYGETLVVDWGLAKRLYRAPAAGDHGPRVPGLHQLDPAEMTASGIVVGTPAYMSPEQAEGRQDLLEPTSDVYSLGATLYHLLTGRVPIEHRSSVAEVIQAAIRGEFPPPRQLLPSVDPTLEAICLKAMAFDPENRYATARALADDLERWLADEPVTAYRDPPARALSRWLAHHPSVLIRGLGVVVTLLILALSALALAGLGRQ